MQEGKLLHGSGEGQPGILLPEARQARQKLGLDDAARPAPPLSANGGMLIRCRASSASHHQLQAVLA